MMPPSREPGLTLGPRYGEWQQSDISHAWYDVDGTLVQTGDKGLPSQTFIQLAREAGRSTIQALSTGRILGQASHIITACELDGVSILSNGAERYNGRTGEITRLSIPHDFVTGMVDFLQFNELPFWINDGGRNHFWVPPQPSKEFLVSDDIWVTLGAFQGMHATSYTPAEPLFIIVPDVPSDVLPKIQNHAKKYEQQPVALYTTPKIDEVHPSPTYDIFFQHPRATKEAALLDSLQEAGGVSLEAVLVVDDGPNGVASLEIAGTAVAMGNAAPEVKAVATHIAPLLEEDGIVAVQRELILKR